MKKRLHFVVLCLCFIITFIIVVFLPHHEEIPEQVTDTYIGFLETVKCDYASAVEDYCHFENSWLRSETMHSEDYVTNYEIEYIEQLNKKLWVAKTWVVTVQHPDGRYIVNFIGLIDNKYYIMTGSYQVPKNLLKGCNLDKYQLTGPDIITSDDLIK